MFYTAATLPVIPSCTDSTCTTCHPAVPARVVVCIDRRGIGESFQWHGYAGISLDVSGAAITRETLDAPPRNSRPLLQVSE